MKHFIITSLIVVIAVTLIFVGCVPTTLPSEPESPVQEVPSDAEKPHEEVPSQETSPPQEKPPAEDILSEETDVKGLSVGELAELLTYPRDTGNSLADMVQSWLDDGGESICAVWDDELGVVRESFAQGEMSEQELVDTELGVIENIAERLSSEIDYEAVSHINRTFDLTEVIDQKLANCQGYSQLFWILANSLGLTTKALALPEEPGVRQAHVACLSTLANSSVIIVDIPLVSTSFYLTEAFTEVGGYHKLRDESNPLELSRTRFRILDWRGLAALKYYATGNDVYAAQGQYEKAIIEYDQAIGLDAQCASAYQARGVAYTELEQYDRAMPDFNEALELDPEFALAYHGRGIVYGHLEEYNQVISDCSHAIELAPRYAKVYNTRGFAYINLDEYDEALVNFNKAIELDPELADAYRNRGATYAILGDWDKALADLYRAKELDPSLAEVVDGLIELVEEAKAAE